MEQALYRKYRPRGFDETVGQEHITKTLQKALKAGRISHAYLFTGPRGVGKTSVARILAHEVNNLPYDADSIHLDIIEIDAASNRRIDEIRDLRDKVRIAPTAAKYKVYIIDEVHMLTREAFNALLKTLEEPPAHCIFILATTEAHKLPDTIISRTQRHEFKPVNKVQMADHLAEIAHKEKIEITKEALNMLAEFGEGSFRDSIGYLDQLSAHSQKITEQSVREILGLPAAQDSSEVLEAVQQGDLKRLAETLTRIQGQGTGAAELAAALSKEIRQQAINGQASSSDTKLLKDLVDVKGSSRPAEYLEVILLDATANRTEKASSAHLRAIDDDSPRLSTPKPKATRPGAISTSSLEKAETKSKPAPNLPVSDFSLDLWPDVITKAKDQAASIYTALRLANPSYNDGSLILSFEFPLHQKKLDQAKNKSLVMDIIYSLCGQKIVIKSIVDKGIKKAVLQEPPTDKTLHSISNIFGGAEMIET